MSKVKVPTLDLKRQHSPLYSEIESAVSQVIRSGHAILGPSVEEFEKNAAAHLGVKHALGVSSGTDALVLSLRALGIGAGDKVLTSPFTFFATCSAILNVGAEPVFADIDPETYCLDPQSVEKVLTGDKDRKIKCIVPVHLYGQSADMETLKTLTTKHGAFLVEDAAQAFGTKYKGKFVGGLGDFGCFSFFPTKNLGAYGDAGLITTNDPKLYEKAKMLRAHGSRVKYHHVAVGGNYRLDTIQAAILNVFISHVENWIEQRRDIARKYQGYLTKVLTQVSLPIESTDSLHSYHQYTLRVLNGGRDSLAAYLQEKGIASTVYYPIPCHLQEALRAFGGSKIRFPKAEQAAQEVLSIPVFPGMSDTEVNTVASAIKEWDSLNEQKRAA